LNRPRSFKTVLFAKPQEACFLKLTALSEQQDQPFTSIAELTVIEQKP
jgi:hypothetical protein